MYMDSEFNYLDKIITSMYINTMAAREQIPEIERQIQVIKERIRALHGGLPYYRMTSRMVIELGKYIVMMINAFPPKSCISCTYSPHTIMTGKQLGYKKKLRCPFGTYVKAHNDRNVTNQMIDRSQGTI